MPDYQYAYLVGALIFVVAWLLLYIFGPRHRRQMVWGSLLAAPFAATGFLFIPEYWSPPSLFDLALRVGISIEDVVWSAAVGGIASGVSEIMFHQRLARMRAVVAAPRYKPLVVIVVIFVALELVWPAKSIYNMVVAFVVGAVVMAIVRRDLIGRMLRGAAVFTVVYALLFAYFLALYSEFIERYYNHANLLGISIAGIPIEELLFAYSGGAVWTVMYEFVHDYRLESVRPLRFVRQSG
jgi:hypothetical protein